VSIIRSAENDNTVAHAFDSWCLDRISQLIDSVADGSPPPGKTWTDVANEARRDLRMMPRLVKLAQAIFAKYEKGELTQAEARALNGTTDEEH